MQDFRRGIVRWRRATIIGAGCATVLALAASVAAATTRPAADLGLCDVVVDAGGVPHRFRVELASTPEHRAQGLQGRQAMAADAGMLFDFGPPQPVRMWMMNTPIPLDMVFIDAAGQVVAIAERTEPYSLDIIASPVPVRAVLEVQGGTAQRIGLKPGAHLIASCVQWTP